MLNIGTKVWQQQYPACRMAMAALASRYASGSTSGEGQRTALYDFHTRNAGKIVNFGGYALPVQYADLSITASHLHTRRVGSIFDVSHMLQTYVRGRDAAACLESVCTADIANAAQGSGSLTVFTNATGCILDDLIVTKVNEQLLYVVSNAAMKAQDMQIMSAAVDNFSAQGKDVSIEFLTPEVQSLIAVQGPAAALNVAKLLPKSENINELYFMHTMAPTEFAGVRDCRITRCGYTGEDGVEISVPSAHIEQVTAALLAASTDANEQLKLAGLGARDSLRLEAGLCLYGSDIDAQTTPIEAGLAWLVAKRRRAELNFPGAQTIVQQLKLGVGRRRVGFRMSAAKAPPARAGVEIYKTGKLVGHITSGCPSPSTGKNIAMGYIAEADKAPGTNVEFKIRDKIFPAEVVRMPFVKSNYYVKPKK